MWLRLLILPLWKPPGTKKDGMRPIIVLPKNTRSVRKIEKELGTNTRNLSPKERETYGLTNIRSQNKLRLTLPNPSPHHHYVYYPSTDDIFDTFNTLTISLMKSWVSFYFIL